MDTQQENQTPDMGTNTVELLSVGQTLRAAREKMGLSVNDVANRIKFATRQVESLEADDYAKLPEAAFVRGFVRSYARLLELDAAKLISGLPSSHANTASATQEMKSVEIPMPTELTARRYNIVLLAVGLAIALSVAIFERMHDQKPEVTEQPVVKTNVQTLELPNVTAGGASDQASEQVQGNTAALQQLTPVAAARIAPAAQQVSPPVAVRVPSAPQQPAPQAAARATPVITAVPPQPAQHSSVQAAPHLATASQQSAPISVSKPALTDNVAPADKPQVGADVNSAEHALRLEFDEDSWVEIKDTGEKPLVARIHRAGSLVRLTGKAPLMVTIGNARAVRLFDNGKKINLERYTTAEVAHITLK